MSKISRDDVLKLAQLSRLSLDEEEVAEFADELAEILQYVEMLQTANIEGLQPTSQVTGLTNVTRDDTVLDYGYEPAELLRNVPHVKDGQIQAKRMIG